MVVQEMAKSETTAEAITRALVEHSIDTVFGIPGVHMYDFNDALHRAGDKIKFIHTRHEQGAAYMAYGYAKATGRIGAFTVVPGPGVLNAGAALCTALGANAPVLCITGNIMSHLIGRGRGQLHELPDQLATLRGITKVAERIDHQSEAGFVVSEVISKMISGRKGPGSIEAPWDVFGQKGPEVPIVSAARAESARPDPLAIEQAIQLISNAKRPLITVGGGAVDARKQVRELAERLGAPVTAHRSGKGVLPDDHPNALNLVAAYDYWKDTDLLIGVGSRLELQFMRWRYIPKNLKVIRIDIDPKEMVRLRPDAAIVADAADGVDALLEQAPRSSIDMRLEDFARLNNAARERFAAVEPQVSYVNAIRRALPRDGFFVEEISQVGFTARFAFPVFAPLQYVTCGYQETLGFGFNTALGVKVAHPDKMVISVSGDGGFMFGLQELATAVQHRINVIAIVFNNGSFGNVLRDQRQSYDGRYLGSELTNPDFVKLAESFNIPAFKATTPEELERLITTCATLDSPVLIEVPVDRGSEVSPWTYLHPAPHPD